MQYTTCRIGNSARYAGQGSRNTGEVTIVGSHHPPAVKVGAGDAVWCKELSGLNEVFGRHSLRLHPPKGTRAH